MEILRKNETSIHKVSIKISLLDTIILFISFSLIVITENSLRCNSVEVSVCVQDERLFHIPLRAMCDWSPRQLRHRMQQRKNF